MTSFRSKVGFLTGLMVLAVGVVALCPLWGVARYPLSVYWDSGGDPSASMILWEIRIPRVLFGFLAGSSLALCGLVFQSIFRNPLATPYTIGVSSGAALGAVSGIMLGLTGTVGGWLSLSSLAAVVGAFSTVFLVAVGSQGLRHERGVAMLLFGVVVSFFFGSIIVFLQYLADYSEVFRITRWLMGSVDTVGYHEVSQLFPLVLLGTLVIVRFGRELTLLSFGADFAQVRGVHASQVLWILFFVTSMMTGVVVSLCGPIGFVGIMVPHVCRRFVGHDHRWLILSTFLLGGLMLVICDAVGRTLLAPSEIPVGIITALIGGPFFLILLFRGLSWRSTNE